MKFYCLNSKRQRNVNISRYLIDWERVVSAPQKQVKDFLRPYWRSAVCVEELLIPGSRLRCDLINLTRRVVVEVSPDGSHSFNQFFHKNRLRFGAAIKRELDKEAWATANGLIYVEIFEEDLDALSPQWFLENYEITL